MIEAARNRLLVCTLRPVEAGETFAKIPLHTTVQPWFAIDPDFNGAFLNALTNYAYNTKPFSITGGEKAEFGPNSDVPVRILNDIGSLALVHKAISSLVKKYGGEIDPTYTGDNYTPHVSYSMGENIDESETVTLKSMQLFRKLDVGQKLVERVFYFHKKR